MQDGRISRVVNLAAENKQHTHDHSHAATEKVAADELLRISNELAVKVGRDSELNCEAAFVICSRLHEKEKLLTRSQVRAKQKLQNRYMNPPAHCASIAVHASLARRRNLKLTTATKTRLS